MAKTNWQKKEIKDAKEFGGKQTIRSGGVWFCVPEEYEVLMGSGGWKRIDSLKKKEIIYTFNLEERAVEKAPIDKMLVFENSLFKSMTNKNHEISFTEGHRFVWGKDDRLVLSSLDNLNGKITSYKLLAAVQSGREEYYISDDELRIIAWILTDGTVVEKGEKVGYNVSIYQSKPKMVKRIEALLKKENIEFSKYKRKINGVFKANYPNFQFYIKAPKEFLNKYSLKSDKFPFWLYQLSDRQVADVFLPELMLGDGCENALYGKRKTLSKLQGLFATHGITSSLRENNRGEFYLIIKKAKGHWLSSVKDGARRGTSYCLQNKNETMIMRTPNGTVFVSGNSKGDVRTDTFLIDSKTSAAQRFSITKKMWKKISREALLGQRLPMLSVKFSDEDLEVVVLDKDDFLEMTKNISN